MKKNTTSGLCVLMCLVMIFSVFTACSKKNPDDDLTGYTATTIPAVAPADGSGQGLGYVYVDLTTDEVIKFVKGVLGDAAKDFNGDLSTLTSDQLDAVEAAAELKGYMLDKTRTDGKYYLVKAVTKTELVEISEPELAEIIEEALGEKAAASIGSDLTKLTDKQLDKVTKVAEDKGYEVKKDENGKVTIEKEVPAEPSVIVNPTTVKNPPTDAEIKNAIISVLGNTGAQSFDGNMNSLPPETRAKLEKKFAEIGATDAVLDRYWAKYYPAMPVSPTVPATTKTPSGGVIPTSPQITTKYSGNSKTTVKYTGTPQTIVTATAKQMLTTKEYVRSAKSTWVATNQNSVISNGSAVTADGGVVTVGNAMTGRFASGVITKYKADGAVLWSHVIGGDDLTTLNEVAVLADGSIVAVGETHASNLVDEQYYKGANTCEGYMVKYSNNGERQWIKLVGGEGSDMLYSIAATPDGGFAIGGKSTSTTVDFAGYVGNIKSFVFKCNASGGYVWKHVMAGNKHCSVVGLCAASNGELFASFETKTISGDFSKIEGLVNNRSAAVIINYSPAGKVQWATPIYDNTGVHLPELACTPDGGVVGVGYYVGGAELNQHVLKGIYNGGDIGTTDGLIIKINSSGEITWILPVIGFQNEYLTDIAPVTGGYLVSGYSKSSNRDLANVGNKGDYDAFVYVVGEYGNYLTMLSLGGTYADRAEAICSNGKNVAYFAGATSSNDGGFKGKGPSSSSNAIAYVSKISMTIS